MIIGARVKTRTPAIVASAYPSFHSADTTSRSRTYAMAVRGDVLMDLSIGAGYIIRLMAVEQFIEVFDYRFRELANVVRLRHTTDLDPQFAMAHPLVASTPFPIRVLAWRAAVWDGERGWLACITLRPLLVVFGSSARSRCPNPFPRNRQIRPSSYNFASQRIGCLGPDNGCRLTPTPNGLRIERRGHRI